MQNQIPKNPPARSRKAEEDWQKVKLGEISNIKSGDFVPKEERQNTGEMPMYGSGGIVGYTNRSNISGPTIVVGRVGAFGTVSLVESGLATDNTLMVTNKPDTDINFLYYKMGTVPFGSIATGSSQQLITQTAVAAHEVIVPSLEKQQKIAEVLSTFDDKIEVNNKVAKTLEDMAQAIFKEWFVYFRFPGYEKVEFADSELERIPKGWEVKKIKDIAKINKGLSYSSTEISEKGEGLPMINLANFHRGGGFNPNGIKFYTGRYRLTNLVKPGDVVIAMTDLTSNREVIGHPARVPSYAHWDKILISLDVCSVEIDGLYVEFLYYLMIRKDFSYKMASSAGGTNVAHLSKSTIEDYTFVFPEKSLIEKFQNFVRPIFNRINIVEQENQKLAALRDLLLPKLMRGEIRV